MARPLPTHEQAVNHFWSKVDRSETCWLWQAATDRYGYGASCHNGRQIKAHRLAYLLFVDNIPSGQAVCHTCDNPACVRPDHLFLGSVRDNNTDRARKDRNGYQDGTENPNAKLTEGEVREIRGTYASEQISQRALASRYGISQMTISLIVNGKRWQHVQ